MKSHDRRRFVAGMGAAFALGPISGALRAQMKPDDKFDLVIKGGELLDPAQKLRGKRDIGIRFGKIAAIEADIPAARANRVLDASGKLVLPGLIDLHCARLSVRLGDRHPGRRADSVPGHHHRWCRRATPARTTSPPSAAT